MSRPFAHTAAVPADVETAFAVLTGSAWPAALASQLPGSEVVSAEPTEHGGVVVVLRRRLPDAVPGPLRSLAPADGSITQTDTWGPPTDGGRRGTWSATFPGSPGNVSGGMSLLPAGSGSTWTVEGSVRVRVPVLGGRIEAYVAPLLEQLLTVQGDVLRAQFA